MPTYYLVRTKDQSCYVHTWDAATQGFCWSGRKYARRFTSRKEARAVAQIVEAYLKASGHREEVMEAVSTRVAFA